MKGVETQAHLEYVKEKNEDDWEKSHDKQM